MKIKAISLTQPWATLMAIEAKKYETRGWYTNHRGPTAIHAAKGFPKEAQALCLEEPFCSVLRAVGYNLITDLPLGCILAVGNLNTVYKTTYVARQLASQEIAFGDYSAGRYAYQFLAMQRLAIPIPAKGALGFWDWEAPEGVLEYPGRIIKAQEYDSRALA